MYNKTIVHVSEPLSLVANYLQAGGGSRTAGVDGVYVDGPRASDHKPVPDWIADHLGGGGEGRGRVE